MAPVQNTKQENANFDDTNHFELELMNSLVNLNL